MPRRARARAERGSSDDLLRHRGTGTTIVLKRADGTVVKNARHGNKTFVIRDRSSFHNFRLYGPGIDRHTGAAFVGKRTWSALSLQIGKYTIVCDLHPLTMIKTFKVF
jgi:hypothetical protein